jgi:hypothetical protein
MKDFILDEECAKKDYNYGTVWEDEEEERIEKELKELPKGKPRIGIKGKYLKTKGCVSKKRIKNSYFKGFKALKGEI